LAYCNESTLDLGHRGIGSGPDFRPDLQDYPEKHPKMAASSLKKRT
jgi:hypothetical protein